MKGMAMKLLRLPLIGMALLTLALNLSAQERSDANFPCPIYGPGGQVMPVGNGPYYHCQEGPWTPPPATDEINLVQVGTMAGPMYYTMSTGDSDSDDMFEVFMYIKDTGSSFTYRGYERQPGTNSYPQAFQNTAGLIPYAFGNADGDNLPDVVGQWSSWVYMYESPAVGQYANTQVWQSPAMPNVTGFTALAPVDGDQNVEIIHSWNSFGSDNRLVIFENTGNNQFQEIYNQPVSTNNTGQKAIWDFDGDGRIEIAMSSGNGDVYVYESPSDNTFQQVFHGTMGTWNTYACVRANDMDGNGRKEFIVGGSDATQSWVTQVYEATANNTYVVRQTIIVDDNYFGVPGLCAGDFDGDGVDEFLIQGAQSLHVYDWNGQQYAEVQVVPENFGWIQHGIFANDNNFNSTEEVFWLGLGDGGYWTNLTVILESPPGTQPELDVELAPLNPPIQIPPSGGAFQFVAAVQRTVAPQSPFWAWARVRYPDGSYTDPTLGPIQINPPVGVTVLRTRTQSVPGAWPSGVYTYVGYVHTVYSYPATDSAFFNFTKLADGPLSPWVTKSSCTGEPFPGEEALNSQPSAFSLCSASPNPFNPVTTISYKLQAASYTTLKVYDIVGRLVATLADGWQEAGSHEVRFDGSKLASGIYCYRLEMSRSGTTPTTVVRKMMLVK